MNEKIKTGYYIKTVSWENDGDIYRTTHLYGLTKEQAQMYYDAAMIIHTSNRNGFGNDVYNQQKHGLMVRSFLIKHQETLREMWSDETINFEEYDDDDIQYAFGELSYELVGSSENYDIFRVVENINVYDIPFEIEYPDVTEQFKNG